MTTTWSKRATESARAYEAFASYRDLGADRSLEAVGQKLGKSKVLMETWSSQHAWVKRVSDYDAHQDRLRREANDRAVVAMAERQARDMELLQDGLRPFIKALAAKANRTEEEIAGMHPVALAGLIKELAPALKGAMEGERKARGLEDVKVAHTHTVVVEDMRRAYEERRKRRAPPTATP
jgi:hypothetical protein